MSCTLSEARCNHLRSIAQKGGKARAQSADMKEVGARGGRTTLERHGVEHMSSIGRVGGPIGFDALYRSLGDRGQAVAFLCKRGRMAKPWTRRPAGRNPKAPPTMVTVATATGVERRVV